MFVAICMMFLSFLPSASADEWTKKFTVESTPKVRVETSDANIRITAVEGKTVDARVTTQGWKIGGDGINIIDRQTGDSIEIEIRFPRKWFQMNWSQRRVDIEIKVPTEANLNLHTGDGNVDLQGVRGDIVLHSGDGKIGLSELQGTLRASTGDGNIELRNVKG
jgi:DUF4097 and DUF4098 domain-containing protein YvlB